MQNSKQIQSYDLTEENKHYHVEQIFQGHENSLFEISGSSMMSSPIGSILDL